ncbi:MAG: hypothetical protein ABI295_09995 [Xanthomarina sp.]
MFKLKAEAVVEHHEVLEVASQAKKIGIKADENKSTPASSGPVEVTKTYNTRMKEGYFGNRRR